LYHAIISSIFRKFNSVLTYLFCLQDNVRCMVRKFLEFTINNYKNCTEPILILKDFQLSMVRIFSWFFFCFVLFLFGFLQSLHGQNNFFSLGFSENCNFNFFYFVYMWLLVFQGQIIVIVVMISWLFSLFMLCKSCLWTDFASFCFSSSGTWFEWLLPSRITLNYKVRHAWFRDAKYK